ncbi:MAG: hypothetical protein ACYDCL_23525 [Myxococcales bacterium]
MRRILVGLALAAGCAHAPPPRAVTAAMADAVGQIGEVDPFEHRLTVTTATGTFELRATQDSEVVGDTGVGWLPLSELHPGDEVRVAWRLRTNGARELTRLRVLPPKGEPLETERTPDPRDDDEGLLRPAGGLSPLPIGGP